MEAWNLPVGLEVAWTLLSGLAVCAALVAGGHAVLYKRDTRSAVGWMGLIVLVPFVGSVLYLLLGINRIRRRAVALRQGAPQPAPPPLSLPTQEPQLDSVAPHKEALAALMARVTGQPLLEGHAVTPLDNGDAAYPRMLEAIEGAQHTVWMSTYIFDVRGPGAAFVDALAAAHARGVQVRVLIDAVGLRYARPRAHGVLRARGIRTAAFLPALSLGYSRFYNLRNHRKILVVDGKRAFTGGMNIRSGHVLRDAPLHPTRDLHFELSGPVAAWLAGVFADDWAFAVREELTRPSPEDCERAGPVFARGVVDGPDADLNKFRWAMMGGLACATRSVKVVTPYFLPDAPLQSALTLAALRGVEVDVVVPGQGNLPVVNWAMRAHLAHEVDSPVRYWLSPGPFDHSKMLVVDGAWSLVGSANWDPRSLRLNFEVGVECYDVALAKALEERVAARIATARRLTREEVAARSLSIRLRDGLARLFTPYL